MDIPDSHSFMLRSETQSSADALIFVVALLSSNQRAASPALHILFTLFSISCSLSGPHVPLRGPPLSALFWALRKSVLH